MMAEAQTGTKITHSNGLFEWKLCSLRARGHFWGTRLRNQ